MSYTTHAVLPSGWKTMRFGLPRPSGIVPTTSSVSVSMTDTDSDLVLVMKSVAAAAGTAAPSTAASISVTTSLGTSALLTWPSRSR